ncbi:MAG TPA: hypothetical protein HPP66_09750 [Planctomycetes bacterium]|nr:hypothetical protein [Planctomycetota bacterium]
MGGRTNLKTSLLMAIFLAVMAYGIASGKVVYVDDDGPLLADGKSWATAFKYLQNGIVVAFSGDSIRVAEGTYKPTDYVLPPPVPPPSPPGSSNGQGFATMSDDRRATFYLRNGVVIEGGYAGLGEPNPNARDIEAYETILSGDIGIVDNNSDNSFHIVTGNYTDSTAVLDGFTVTGGNVDIETGPEIPFGAGMLALDGSATLANCTFTGNSAYAGGGVCYLAEETEVGPTLTNCTFTGNSAEIGGALVGAVSAMTITNCTFTGNSATSNFAEIGMGGALYHVLGTLTLNNCIFTDNSAEIGGALIGGQCNSTLTNCTFTGNSGEYYGGAFYNESGSATIINCIFNQNSSSLWGGAINEAMSSSSLYNCLFTGNSCSMYGGAMYYWYGCEPSLYNCTFAGNSAPSGNAIACSTPEGGEGLPPSTVSVFNSIFWDGGGEIWNDDNSAIMITYSDVQGGWLGQGNINADPRFVEPGYSGPISYWKLDEAGGTTATDSVGTNDGTIYGAQWTTGQVGGASNFDGLNDYVRIPGNVALTNLNKITLEAWIYPRQDSHWHILDKGDGDKRIYAEGTSLTLDGRVRYTGSDAFVRSVSNTVILNTWQHVALTWSRADNTTRLYHNGLEVNYSAKTVGSGSPLYDTSHPWTIAARGALGPVTFFDGLIDEAAIYDQVLSADKIYQHYYSGLSGQGYQGINLPDYHLLPNSQCINSGDPHYMAEPNETDLDGKPRVIRDRIDMGAYEFNHIPVADAGPDQTIGAQGPGGATVTLDGSGSSDGDSTPGTNDDISDFVWNKADPCDPNTGVFLGSGRIIDCNLSLGEHIITLKVFDKAGAFDIDEVTIIVQDATPPVFTKTPQDFTVECDGNYNVAELNAWLASATAVDKCGSVTITNDFVGILNECGATGSATVTWTAEDESGNTVTSTPATFTILDTTPPVINCPADVTLEYPADTSVEANGSAMAGDTCGTVTITHSDQSQPGCGSAGTLTRTWTATDECGNSSSCVQIITVVDTTPPVINCPADVTLEYPADTSVEANGSATASDTCGTVTITHSDQSQPGCGNTGTLTRTWTATDECGNSSSCVQIITVVDTTPPEFALSVTPTVLWPANHKMVLITTSWTASDKCDASPEVSLVGIVMNEGDDIIGDGHTSDDIRVDDDGSIYLRAERSGTGNDRVYTITYQAVDDCGNIAESSATVTVPHDQR